MQTTQCQSLSLQKKMCNFHAIFLQWLQEQDLYLLIALFPKNAKVVPVLQLHLYCTKTNITAP